MQCLSGLWKDIVSSGALFGGDGSVIDYMPCRGNEALTDLHT